MSASPSGLETKGALELTAAMVLSGTIGVFVVESGASAFNVVFFRCVFGALALGLYCLARGFFRNHGFTAKKLGLTMLGGVFIVANWTFLFSSYDAASISVSTVVYHTQPFYVVLLGALIFREKLTASKFAWLGIAFLGLIMVAGVSASDFENNTAYLIGLGQALLAAVFYAFATIITKRVSGIRPHLVALVQVVLGIVLLLPFVSFGATAGLGADWGWLIGLGVIHTGLMYVLMYSSYQKLPTTKIAVLAFVYPAVAIIADWAVYGHHVDVVQALGIPLIVAASLGVNLGWKLPLRRSRPAATAPVEPAPAASAAAQQPVQPEQSQTPAPVTAVSGGTR